MNLNSFQTEAYISGNIDFVQIFNFPKRWLTVGKDKKNNMVSKKEKKQKVAKGKNHM